jgi:hypothetical protein
VLRASRLDLAPADAAPDAPLASRVTVEDVTYLGDQRRCTVNAGGERIHLLLPSATAKPQAGAPAMLFARHDAIACLSEHR